MELPKQINNINERVVDDLKTRLSAHSRICVAAASFSIYAFEALKKELENVEELRFIFTSPTFVKDKGKKEKREFFIPKLNRERNLYGTDFEIRLRNQLSQKAIAKECAEWIKRKVRFKSNSTGDIMGGFLHVADNSQHVCARASRSMTARSAQPSTRRRKTDAKCANTATCCTVSSTAL